MNWKVVFAEQRAHAFDVWEEPFVHLLLPKLFNLHSDPFERAPHDSNNYPQWRAERLWALVPAQAIVAKYLESFKAFPPRQKAASFSINQVMDKLMAGPGGNV